MIFLSKDINPKNKPYRAFISEIGTEIYQLTVSFDYKLQGASIDYNQSDNILTISLFDSNEEFIENVTFLIPEFKNLKQLNSHWFVNKEEVIFRIYKTDIPKTIAKVEEF